MSYNGYCLYYSTVSKSWSAARADCASRSNGWLVSITNGAMNSIVDTNRAVGTSTYWMGSTCGSSCVSYGGTWVWEDGQPGLYTNWANGYPSYSNTEACLQMTSTTGSWNDAPCSTLFPYICQVLPVLSKCPAGMFI